MNDAERIPGQLIERIRKRLTDIPKISNHVIKSAEYFAPDTILLRPNNPETLESFLAVLEKELPAYQHPKGTRTEFEDKKQNHEGNYRLQVIVLHEPTYPKRVKAAYELVQHLSHILHDYARRPHKKP